MSKCVKCGNEILTGDIHWEMGLCNNCYNELYKDHKTHISLDKMWLELAQSFRDENEKLQDKVADLEAKLAESEKRFVVANNLRKNSDEVLLNYKTKKYGLDKTIEELRKMKLSLPEKEWYYKGFENCERQMSSHIADLTLQVKELKQQLAESEEQLREELEEKNGVRRALSACNRQNDEFAEMIKKLANEKEELKHQLEKSEKSKESYRLQNEQHHLQLLQFYSRLGVEAFGADIHEKALETLMIMKEQLAEKTLTIEQINKAFIENRSLWKGKYERANQDKISFTIEQLEQLKKLCQEKFNWWENSEWEGDIYDKSDVSNAYFDIEANIDNQIKAIKGEK